MFVQICINMYITLMLSEKATEPLHRLALLTACPLLVTVCMADCADVDTHF